MRRDDYDRYTETLVANLQSDDRVLGLVGLGSTAARERQPDAWSDHDFWVISPDEHADELRASHLWLPNSDDIVVRFAETVHGRSVIYANGHLVEYAVFGDTELEIAGSNTFRVLIDRSNIAARMDRLAQATASRAEQHDVTGADRFGSLLAQLTIGINRLGRGEVLSANDLICGRAVRTLVSLLASVAVVEATDAGDNLDPLRRFEIVAPHLAREVHKALRGPLLDTAKALLSIAERELTGHVPAAREAAFSALRQTIDRVEAG